MKRPIILTAAEQVAAYLRELLLQGTWRDTMPGCDKLAEELGVGSDTADHALRQLEAEGYLINQGRRRGRRIVMPQDCHLGKKLRIGFLLDESLNRRLHYIVALEHELVQAGHAVIYSPRDMRELGFEKKRVVNMVKKIDVDAWMILAAPREILEWFVERNVPAMAIFGRRRSIAIAGVGPDKISAGRTAIASLVALGHRRIVVLTRKRRRWPEPGHFESALLDEMAIHGISLGAYHLPEWEETIDGLHARLESLFRLTPPTAMIIDEASFLIAAQNFLARKGLRVPEDVSLISNDDDPAFMWCKPQISHISWESEPVVRRILSWARNVSRGRKDLRQTMTRAEFVVGGTIGKAKG